MNNMCALLTNRLAWKSSTGRFRHRLLFAELSARFRLIYPEKSIRVSGMKPGRANENAGDCRYYQAMRSRRRLAVVENFIVRSIPGATTPVVEQWRPLPRARANSFPGSARRIEEHLSVRACRYPVICVVAEFILIKEEGNSLVLRRDRAVVILSPVVDEGARFPAPATAAFEHGGPEQCQPPSHRTRRRGGTAGNLHEALSAHWADHCAVCHANDGSGDTEMGKHLHSRRLDMRGVNAER